MERRLGRAAAVPAAKRSAEAAAFVEGAALLRQVRQLLPLEPAGRATQFVAGLPYPPTRATAMQLLRAFVMAARADCVGPTIHPNKPEAWPHLCAYQG